MKHIFKSYESFSKSSFFEIIYRMMCQQPYTVAKYLNCKRKGTDIKSLRIFISYISQADIFNT
jgi:hypothetical protein